MMEELCALDVAVLQTGTCGRLEVVPLPPQQDVTCPLPLATAPVGLPPILPDDNAELEELLTSPERLPLYDLDQTQRHWPRDKNVESLYSVDITPVQTTLVVDRNPTTGELLGFKEVLTSSVGETSKNSMSLNRKPGPSSESLRGNTTNLPFWPGGCDEPNLTSLATTSADENQGIDWDQNLLVTPPGFKEGAKFHKKNNPCFAKVEALPSVLNLAEIMSHTNIIDLDNDLELEDGPDNLESTKNGGESGVLSPGIDDIIKLDERVEIPGENLQPTGEKPKEEWAVKIDINSPVSDFYKRIPNMAYTWPFELDVFQKQAILHLEAHDNVFVAAHTSAGKTVVAEYAIALSMKHMTRSIYTSPIKALSNQKFRDFKQTFVDVGLVTGDVQINPQGSCLIMTTEILRSMLYNGSDVIRDLEWVIFDEVHYINDAERGVVWEEVLIMLPQHVNIILLSATVPNTMEFADWVGRTKRRKVYVITTQKRPVPLEHFLYTGNSNKTSNELFVLLDANKNFLTTGYNKAVEAKKERASKSSQSFGTKQQRGAGGPQQDKNVWLSVIEMLKKKDKLPVVAFTFSKKRIQANVDHLKSVDLTSQSEKSEIHRFFQKCISRLKGTDKDLPQVQQTQDHLKRGIGVHHSGILPIVKEVVEMLFQRGMVKILFATETFAMGVNMPARTVVFDTTRKHDGTAFRDLLPGEYIQMAGRAGRRGLDTTGTVILMCKGDVPEMSDLHKMMLGKPTQLQSQFRLTYTMILNLLRVEHLRVEDMMKRSFSEFHQQKDAQQHAVTIQELLKQIEVLPDIYDMSGDLSDYYDACEEYWQLKGKLQKVVMSHPQAVKSLSPGRVIIVDRDTQQGALGVVLQSATGSKEKTYLTLLLCEQKAQPDMFSDSYVRPQNPTPNVDTAKKEDDEPSVRPVLPQKLFRPEGPCGHEMVKVAADKITVITTRTIKMHADRVIDDIKKRQQPRFRSDPPGQNTTVATQELLRLVEANPTGLPGLDAQKDLHIRDLDIVEEFYKLQSLEEILPTYRCIHDPSFQDTFAELGSQKALKARYNELRWLLSDESLQLLPEYQQRIQVLRRLHYIDDKNTVQLKGRVACECSQQELVLAELVFENVLTGLHPTEIAALLSCVVFEQRNCGEPNLAPNLVAAKESFQQTVNGIAVLQKECGVRESATDFMDEFHFGLMEVVYEWARGMPFSDITNLTDVQEGIIVRCIQRLDEVLKDVRNAARIIGDPVLYQKMEEASTMIKRDIVFAASLYTQ